MTDPEPGAPSDETAAAFAIRAMLRNPGPWFYPFAHWKHALGILAVILLFLAYSLSFAVMGLYGSIGYLLVDVPSVSNLAAAIGFATVAFLLIWGLVACLRGALSCRVVPWFDTPIPNSHGTCTKGHALASRWIVLNILAKHIGVAPLSSFGPFDYFECKHWRSKATTSDPGVALHSISSMLSWLNERTTKGTACIELVEELAALHRALGEASGLHVRFCFATQSGDRSSCSSGKTDQSHRTSADPYRGAPT